MRKYLVGLSLFLMCAAAYAVDKVQIVENGTADGVTITDQRISVSSVSVHQLVSSGTLTVSAPAGFTGNIVLVSTGSKELLRVHGSSIVFGVPAYLNTGALAGTGGGSGSASVTTATFVLYAADASTQGAITYIIVQTTQASNTPSFGISSVFGTTATLALVNVAGTKSSDTYTGNPIFNGSSVTFRDGVSVVLTTGGIKIGQHHFIFQSTPMANGILKFEGNRVFTGPDAGGGGSGDNLGNHTMTQPLNAGGFALNNVSSITMQGTGDPVVYTDSTTIKFVVQGATLTVGTTIQLQTASGNILIQSSGITLSGMKLSTKTVLNLPFSIPSGLGSSTMSITNSTNVILNGKARWDAQSSTTGNNAQYFNFGLPGGLNSSAVSVLRNFTINCSSSAGHQDNIVGAADGALQSYTLSFATFGANTNTYSLVYTNPIAFNLTAACVAGGTREIRDLALTGFSGFLSNNPTNLSIRAVRSGDDASTTESVLVNGVIEVYQIP